MKTLLQIVLICLGSSGFAQTLGLPARATNAPDGDALVQQITPFDLAQRDQALEREFLAGNVPDFLRHLCPVTVANVTDGLTNIGTFFAAPDYLCVGSDQNYYLAPIAPATAQRIADRLNCTLPTRKMVDAIYAAAGVKLAPSPIPPSPAMTTVPILAQHNEMVRAQRMALTNTYPLGTLTAGHKKDVVISARLAGVTNKVAIYGWHRTNGVPIQPLYLGHVSWWVDYSQCTRLVSQNMLVNGEKTTIADVLANPKFCGLLSDEGAITNARYSTNVISVPVVDKINQPWPERFHPGPGFNEWTREVKTSYGARILIDAPARESFTLAKPVLLVLYALPNGNTIEQTFGKQLQPGDDWHFDIQHIGAQTRWLRNVMTNHTVVVAYLEASAKSWPAWRKQHNDRLILDMVDGMRGIFSSSQTDVVLASHSGGGSLIFGYLNAVEKIPAGVQRIAFLDSDYAYDTGLHSKKIGDWLEASPEHRLCVLAYEDCVALLDGKTFVSEQGGTWGRSHAWLSDLAGQFQFTSQTNNGLESFSTTGGQIEFLLKENPEKKVFHTVQVERNGFIQALLSGTPDEGKGYEYFGDRVYSNWIGQ